MHSSIPAYPVAPAYWQGLVAYDSFKYIKYIFAYSESKHTSHFVAVLVLVLRRKVEKVSQHKIPSYDFD